MRWEDARYVRLYRDDDGDWSVWEWQARALFPLLLRACDRVGSLKMGKHGARGLAALVRLPVEVVEVGLQELLGDGCVTEPRPGILFVRNYLAAQEAKQSDRARKAAERERERDLLSALADGVIENKSVTNRDDSSAGRTERHELSQGVTRSHTESQPVTPCRAVPCRAEKDIAASGKPEPPPDQDEPEQGDLAAPKRQAYLDAIATASSGRFVASKPLKGGVFKLDAARKRPGALDEAQRIGAWLAAGGDAWRGKMDGRSIGTDLDAWIAQSAAWTAAGGGPVNAAPRTNGPAPPSPVRAVPGASETAALLSRLPIPIPNKGLA